jgi:dolichyl-diphosphooligosaccharide--protein glycosyltransferase
MFGSLFLFALAIRSIGYPTVFSKAGIQLPYAGDAYYHLRRIWFSVANFPESLSFDRYASFPEGSQIVWPAAFDWTIAALIHPFVDPNDQAAVEAMAAWVPAVIGAVTTGMLALFADRLYGRGAGWYAGLLYSALPMSFMYSALGMIDHHVAVALLTTVMLWLACEIFAMEDRAETWSAALVARTTRVSLGLGLATAITILTWPGSLLHISVLQVAFAVRWLSAADRDVARARAVALLIGQAVVAICIAPFTLGMAWHEYGAWSLLVLSNSQPLYFAFAAGLVCVVQLIHERDSVGDSHRRRIATGIAAAPLSAFVLLVVLPPLREAIIEAGGWFAQGEDLFDRIYEMQPILSPRGHFDLSFAIEWFGPGILVLPLVWLHLAWRAFSARSASHGLILFWSMAFISLTLRQWRFGNTLAVVYVVLIGAVLAEWVPELRRRIVSRPLRPAVEILLVSVLVVWTARTLVGFYQPVVRMSIDALANERLRSLGPLSPGRRIYDDAGRWLARHTPRTSGYLDTALKPEYGVLSSWGTGHLLRYRSERPMIQDNFGPYAGRAGFESAWAYFAERDEAVAIEILEGLGVRYVIGGLTGAGSIQGHESDTMAIRLGKAFGSRERLSTGALVPALTRHRLIFHAHSAPPGRKGPGLLEPRRFESLGVWEIVPGAQIEGQADPGTIIQLRLDIETRSKARHVYRRRTVADDQGAYRFVVPYSTDVSFSPDVRAELAYELSSLGARERLVVREQDVLSSAVIRGPEF